MNWIEKMIAEQCPNGVKKVKLGDVIKNLRTGLNPRVHFKLNTTDAQCYYITVRELKGFDIKVDEKTDRINETARIRINERSKLQINDILFSGTGTIGRTAIVKEAPTNWNIKEGVYAITPDTKLINPYYFIYVLHSSEIEDQISNKAGGSTVKSIPMAELKKLEIPLPSLSIQEEIVSVLDKFSELIEKTDEEIALRQKQYEYYREKLLTFEEGEVEEYLSFGNDFHLKARIGWQGLTKQEYKTSGEYLLITGTDFTNAHTIDFEHCVFVEKERYEQDKNIQIRPEDVLITKDGTLGKVAYIENIPLPCTLNGGVFVVRNKTNKIIPKFLMYYLTSYNFTSWMDKNHTSGSIMHLTQKLLCKFLIPVVKISRQQEIVTILDKFETLISKLKEERELRQKQYEYYREKLLTF